MRLSLRTWFARLLRPNPWPKKNRARSAAPDLERCSRAPDWRKLLPLDRYR